MKFTVEQWSPERAAPIDVEAGPSSSALIDLDPEIAAGRWAPVAGPGEAPRSVLFIDGVRRIDAWVWIRGEDGHDRPGICASYAAGAMRCEARAQLEGEPEVKRELYSPEPGNGITTKHVHYDPVATAAATPEALQTVLQHRMGELETVIAGRATDAELVVVDGPLRGGRSGTLGFIKSHQVRYLPDEAQAVMAALAPGERTPIFLVTNPPGLNRYSWYLRLPGGNGGEWSGIARCEAATEQPLADVISLAGMASAALPRFASAAHKDRRAPQNLYPIGGLERELRRRLGDPWLLYRGLFALNAAG